VDPHLLDLSGGQGRFLPGEHINSNRDGNDHGRNDAGQDNVACTLGVFLTAGGIVDFVLVILVK